MDLSWEIMVKAFNCYSSIKLIWWMKNCAISSRMSWSLFTSSIMVFYLSGISNWFRMFHRAVGLDRTGYETEIESWAEWEGWGWGGGLVRCWEALSSAAPGQLALIGPWRLIACTCAFWIVSTIELASVLLCLPHTHTHTPTHPHTHTHIYTSRYLLLCVCVCVLSSAPSEPLASAVFVFKIISLISGPSFDGWLSSSPLYFCA